eukprot:Em0526g2a
MLRTSTEMFSHWRRKSKLLNTNSDTKDNRRQILQLVDDTTALARITETSCRKVDPTDLSDRQRMQYGRLMKAFKDSMTRFQSLQQTTAEMEQEAFDRTSAAGSPIAYPSPIREATREEPRPPSFTPQAYRQVQASTSEANESAAAIRQLESNINDMKTIFDDLAAMVAEQGEVVEQIGEKTEIAANHVESGNQELVQATKYKKCSNRLTCCIVYVVVTVLVIVLVTVLVVVLVVLKIVK